MTLVHHSATATFVERLQARLAEAMALRRRAQAQVRATGQLHDLDDHLLRDIGLDPHAFRMSGQLPVTWRI